MSKVIYLRSRRLLIVGRIVSILSLQHHVLALFSLNQQSQEIYHITQILQIVSHTRECHPNDQISVNAQVHLHLHKVWQIKLSNTSAQLSYHQGYPCHVRLFTLAPQILGTDPAAGLSFRLSVCRIFGK